MEYFLNMDEYCMVAGQFRTTSAEVTPNDGLVRESPPKIALNQVKDL